MVQRAASQILGKGLLFLGCKDPEYSNVCLLRRRPACKHCCRLFRHDPENDPSPHVHTRITHAASGTQPSAPHHPAPRLWQRDQRITARLQNDFNDQGVCFYPAPCHMSDGASLTRSRRRRDLAPQPPCSRLRTTRTPDAHLWPRRPRSR